MTLVLPALSIPLGPLVLLTKSVPLGPWVLLGLLVELGPLALLSLLALLGLLVLPCHSCHCIMGMCQATMAARLWMCLGSLYPSMNVVAPGVCAANVYFAVR